MKKLIISILLFLIFSNSITADLVYRYKDEKLYYFEDGRSDSTGAGYFIAAFAGLANMPIFLGAIVGIATVDNYRLDKDVLMASIGGVVAATEIYMHFLPDKTPSYWVNGTIATFPLINSLFFRNEKQEYPPKKIKISSHVFYRSDISLGYDDCRQIYAELREKKILKDAFESFISETYTPTQNIDLQGRSKQVSDHVNWVLKKVYLYNKTGTSNAIVFEAPR